MRHRFLPALLLASLAIPAAYTQHGHATLSNPYTAPEDVAAGGRIYRSHCAVCHGIDGEGGRGTNLTTGMFRHGSSDDDLFKTVSEGIPGTATDTIAVSLPLVLYRVLLEGDVRAGNLLRAVKSGSEVELAF